MDIGNPCKENLYTEYRFVMTAYINICIKLKERVYPIQIDLNIERAIFDQFLGQL